MVIKASSLPIRCGTSIQLYKISKGRYGYLLTIEGRKKALNLSYEQVRQLKKLFTYYDIYDGGK